MPNRVGEWYQAICEHPLFQNILYSSAYFSSVTPNCPLKSDSFNRPHRFEGDVGKLAASSESKNVMCLTVSQSIIRCTSLRVRLWLLSVPNIRIRPVHSVFLRETLRCPFLFSIRCALPTL